MATENRKVSTRRLSNARRKRIQNRRMMIAISAVVVAFCIVIGGQMISKYSTLADLREQERKLKNQEEYVKTDDYVEQMARNLGLLYPNEVIFKPED